jgi:hypothetical protein
LATPCVARTVQPAQSAAQCRWYSISSGLVLDDELYHHFKPRPDEAQSNFLEKLALCRMDPISADVSVINFADKKGVTIESLSPDMLFVRPFYPDLLMAIRKRKRAVLIGNPGIGKSFFQFYYLARIMNPSLFGPLPPDCYGSTAAPKIVIRQQGTSSMTVYDIENRKVDRISCNPRIFEIFDPETSLYLMEPGETVTEPFFAGLNIPTLATVSPMLARYKEFCKNGGLRLYMPVFTLPELLAIGQHLMSTGRVPDELLEAYSPASIQSRFETFGGILRHVLPLSLADLDDCILEQQEAVASCDTHALLVSGNLERVDVSHYIMQYKVHTKGVNPFRTFELNFVSESVAAQVQDKLNRSSMADRVTALIHNDETGSMAAAYPKIYEGVIADLLTTGIGVRWKRREVLSSGVAVKSGDVWADMELKLKDRVDGEVPPFEDMKAGMLYVPLKPNFPFIDMMYKTENGEELVMIQVTRQKAPVRMVSPSKLMKFLAAVGLSGADVGKVRLVFIPLPSRAATAKLRPTKPTKAQSLEEGGGARAALSRVLEKYEVWALPAKYTRGFYDI